MHLRYFSIRLRNHRAASRRSQAQAVIGLGAAWGFKRCPQPTAISTSLSSATDVVMPKDNETLLTIGAAAQRYNVTASKLYQYVHDPLCASFVRQVKRGRGHGL